MSLAHHNSAHASVYGHMKLETFMNRLHLKYEPLQSPNSVVACSLSSKNQNNNKCA